MDEFERTHKQSAELFRKAMQIMPSGSTHDSHFVKPFPIYFSHGLGSHKWDVDGNEYIDYSLSSAALLLGHSHPEVVEAVRTQASRAFHFGAANDKEVEWATLVNKLIPSAERIRFTGSGTESTLLAIRVARAHSGKNKVLRFEGHYHGWHDYVALGGEPPLDKSTSLGVPSIINDLTVVIPPDAGKLEQALIDDDDIACVILEPSGATWGMVPLLPQFVQEVRAITSRHHVICIFDEVITGFGRTGRLFASEHWNVVPDILLVAKALGGGMPLGAFISTPQIMATLSHDPALAHVTTFGGHPVCCAAGIASLDVILQENLVQCAQEKGEEFVRKLKTLRGEGGCTEVRGRGLLIGMDFATPHITQRFVQECFARSLVLGWTLHEDTVVRLAPPLVISSEEIDRAVSTWPRLQ